MKLDTLDVAGHALGVSHVRRRRIDPDAYDQCTWSGLTARADRPHEQLARHPVTDMGCLGRVDYLGDLQFDAL